MVQHSVLQRKEVLKLESQLSAASFTFQMSAMTQYWFAGNHPLSPYTQPHGSVPQISGAVFQWKRHTYIHCKCLSFVCVLHGLVNQQSCQIPSIFCGGFFPEYQLISSMNRKCHSILETFYFKLGKGRGRETSQGNSPDRGSLPIVKTFGKFIMISCWRTS